MGFLPCDDGLVKSTKLDNDKPHSSKSPVHSELPYGADQTVYLVVDRLSSGSVYRETEVERTDLETIYR